jgi:hypothetical protein
MDRKASLTGMTLLMPGCSLWSCMSDQATPDGAGEGYLTMCSMCACRHVLCCSSDAAAHMVLNNGCSDFSVFINALQPGSQSSCFLQLLSLLAPLAVHAHCAPLAVDTHLMLKCLERTNTVTFCCACSWAAVAATVLLLLPCRLLTWCC